MSENFTEESQSISFWRSRDTVTNDSNYWPIRSGVNTAKSEELYSQWENWISPRGLTVIRKKKTIWKQKRRFDVMALKEKFRNERQRFKTWVCLVTDPLFKWLSKQCPLNPKTFWSFFSPETRANRLPDAMVYPGISISDDTKKAWIVSTLLQFYLCISIHSSCPTSHKANVNLLINNHLDREMLKR